MYGFAVMFILLPRPAGTPSKRRGIKAFALWTLVTFALSLPAQQWKVGLALRPAAFVDSKRRGIKAFALWTLVTFALSLPAQQWKVELALRPAAFVDSKSRGINAFVLWRRRE